MKTVFKKSLTWLLTLCLILTLLPATVLAVGGAGELNISGGTSGKDYSVSDGVVNILTSTDMTVSGTATVERIVVGNGVTANLTFSGLIITADNAAPVSVEAGGTLNLTLTGDNSLNATGGSYVKAALNVYDTASLTISGTGSLTAIGTPGYSSTGIGANIGSQNTGTITISGGTINAVGGLVGIGGKSSGITISGGTVTAKGTENSGVGIGGDDCTVSISGANTVVNAYGLSNGIGAESYDGAIQSISITGGTVTAWSACTIGNAPLYTVSYEQYNGDSKYGIGGASGIISITGGTVDARGYNIGIGGSGVTSISIGGSAIVNALASVNNGCIGIGGNLQTGKVRNITICENSVVGAWNDFYGGSYNGGSMIGGGDNSGSTITVKDNAVVKSASDIGSGDLYTGYAGGTISVLDSASIQNPDASYLPGANHIGGANCNNDNGGAGGNIAINTTGTVVATSIGGGNGKNGGDGGTIVIQNGKILTDHIGGGDGIGGYNDSGTWIDGNGGSGGNITISRGQVGDYSGGPQTPTGSINKKVGSGANTRYYSAAGIGGGGGTLKGGDGGTITITGGKVCATAGVTVYDPSTGNTAANGIGIGGAGIGGGNGACGGTINISGGRVEVGVSMYPYEATTATAAPALIGGGSTGGAGQITISGGYVTASVYSQNAPMYGDDATVIGQGKGATDAGGCTKVTGGTLQIPLNTYQTTVARPVPWPVAVDGSTPLYPVTLSFYDADKLPDGLSFYDNSEIVSMTITKKNGGGTYSYGTKDMNPTSCFWLPIEENTNTWNTSHELYDVTVSVKKDKTVYGFTGVIRYSKNPNYVGGIAGSSSLTYTGEVIESLQITSDWGSGVKTYDGTDQKPTFTVKNINGDTLVAGTDYTLKIEYDGYGTKSETSVMKNAGGYYVTATGAAGTAYEGMTATLDKLWINPKEITAIYSGSAFTKQYDGTINVYNGATKVESLALTVNSADLCTGDAVSNIVADNPRYDSSGVGTGIKIVTNSPSYTYTQNGQPSSIYNYTIALPENLKGDITVKVIGKTNLNTSGVTVTKVYDGKTDCTLTNVSGSVTLVDLVGTEVATVNITGVSAFDSKNVGNSHTVTLTIGNLAGANAENYTLAGGVTAIQLTNASITPADYAYNLTGAQQAQEFIQGGSLSHISLPQTASGVNGETVTGTVSLWHDAACTANQATDSSVNALSIGSHNLYVKFVPSPSETNYTTKVTTGKVVVLTVVEGNPQDLSFEASNTVSKTYGDIPFTNLCTNNSNGGTITYTSSNTAVAAVDSSSGKVTIKGAGSAVITATAAAVGGQYRSTSISYTLIVGKKNITVTADNKTKTYGTANPALTFIHNPSDLASGDVANDLAVTLSCAATATSPAGTPVSITGTSASKNYNVTVTPGTLTINKAGAPTVANVTTSLLFSKAHMDVTANIPGLPADRGTTSFAAGTVTGDTGIINGVTNTSTGIKYSTNIGTENQTATIPVTITMQNYLDATVNVVVTLANKKPVTITGVTVADKTYSGISASYTGTPANGQGYTGTYEYVWSSGSAPKDAGSYTLTVKIPENNADYMGKLEIPFTIAKKALTIKPKNISIYNGAALPTSFTLEYVGLVSGDTIIPSGTPEFKAKNGTDTLTNSSTNGTYTIEWINKDNVLIDHNNYTITKADGTLTISSQPSPGGGGVSTPITTTPTPETTTTTTTPTTTTPPVSIGNGVSTATLAAQVKTGGTIATASVSSDDMKNAIEAAQKAASKNNTASAVEIQAKIPEGATEIGFSIPKPALSAVTNSNAKTLSMISDIGKLDLSAQTVTSIAKQAGGSDVVMSVAKVDVKKTLNAKQQTAVGTAPVYNISITSGGSHITSFDGGTVTIILPYKLKDGENASGIVVWYLDTQGNTQKMKSVYNTATGTVSFTTNHLSLYVVGYDKTLEWNNPFNDVSKDAWYYNSVRFAHQRGMINGTSTTVFSPDMTTSRAMLVTILYRLEGSPATSKASFTDVVSSAWYANAVAWAVEKGIAAGYGGGQFGPENSITREQMAVILMNYARFKGYDTTAAASSLSSFTDAASISSWASEAMEWTVSHGLINGKNDKILDPNASATRSQVATILMRLYELPKK